MTERRQLMLRVVGSEESSGAREREGIINGDAGRKRIDLGWRVSQEGWIVHPVTSVAGRRSRRGEHGCGFEQRGAYCPVQALLGTVATQVLVVFRTT